MTQLVGAPCWLRPTQTRRGDCWGVLHGLRCLGARLEVAANGLRVAPGEIAPDEYTALRERYLMPIAARVTRLLRVASAPDGLPSGDRERM